jgi:RNA polymerase sigma factor (sigma-70 family)
MTAIEFNSQLIGLERSLMKFAYRLTSGKDDAKDLVQETFLKVLLRKDKYIHTEKFKSWTFTILKNTFVDNYRRSSNKDAHYDQADESFFINQSEPAVPEDPDNTYSALEINQKIDLLKEKLRIPLKMYINGYKYIEIAKELNLKIGTVKNRIFLSRKELQHLLNG